MGCSKMLKDIFEPKRFCIPGSAISVKTLPSNRETNTIVRVSVKNCTTSWLRWLPITLRMPTSFERLTACAVAKLIKLIDAVIIKKKPIIARP
ncbi:hypothetical protein D3C85_1340470 [compost metagenome]